MLTYPNIDPVAIALGPLQVHWYGLMYLLAFLFAWGLASYRAKERGWTPDMVSDLIFYGALGVVIGGRVGYVFFYGFEQFLANPIWLFQVWTGGMSFHGGFLGVMLAMLFWCKKYKMTWFQTLDFIAPCVPTGLMFGRIGNFIGGELYGRPVADPNFALGMIFPTDPLQLIRHPSQLYQAFFEELLSSTFIQSPIYGTRCSNFLRMTHEQWSWLEKQQQDECKGKITEQTVFFKL
jgi:phosphatidylglycerol---prolipoprotein diacylglyceryl transferase